jgi:hypothetical protein
VRRIIVPPLSERRPLHLAMIAPPSALDAS